MRFFVCVTAAVLLALSGSQLRAQGGIAVVDLETVLDLMPESSTMQQELDIYQRKRRQALKLLSDSIEQMDTQLRQQAQSGVDRARLMPFAQRVQAMQQRLDSSQQAVEQAVAFRQQLFMQEIRSKVDRHLAELAEEQNYTYIFNARAAGSSLLLEGQQGNNLTRELLEHMQVPLGVEEEVEPSED